MNFRSLDDFWAYYMTQHSKAATRRWHLAATLAATLIFICSLVVNWRLMILAPLVGYGVAWSSHLLVEGNVPASFGHPIWSFMCDWKMCGLICSPARWIERSRDLVKGLSCRDSDS